MAGDFFKQNLSNELFNGHKRRGLVRSSSCKLTIGNDTVVKNKPVCTLKDTKTRSFQCPTILKEQYFAVSNAL